MFCCFICSSNMLLLMMTMMLPLLLLLDALMLLLWFGFMIILQLVFFIIFEWKCLFYLLFFFFIYISVVCAIVSLNANYKLLYNYFYFSIIHTIRQVFLNANRLFILKYQLRQRGWHCFVGLKSYKFSPKFFNANLLFYLAFLCNL